MNSIPVSRFVALAVLSLALTQSAAAQVAPWAVGEPASNRVLVQARGDRAAAVARKVPEADELRGRAAERGYVRVIVQFASPVSPGEIGRNPAAHAPVRARIAAARDPIVAEHFGRADNPADGATFGRGLARMDVTPQFAVNVTMEELEALAADPRVESIHYDRPLPPTLIASVPLIGMTGASGAHAAGATGTNRAVAILDTGVQSNHEFLDGKVVSEACFSNAGGFGGAVSLCPNGQPSQTGAGAADATTAQCVNGNQQLCDHGTHVAGIAAGFNTSLDAGEPEIGVAPDAVIVAVQVFTRFNNLVDCFPFAAPCVLSYVSDQISALNWVLQNAVDLGGGVTTDAVNMSLGGGQFGKACDNNPTKPSIDALKAAGVATVIAAGNSGFTNAVSSPGCISTAVTVASSTKTDGISSFTNMGKVVDVMAPGSSILSSVPTAPNPSDTSTYLPFSGTSMATPHVAGVFAALRSLCPTRTVDEIAALLRGTGVPIADNRSGGKLTASRIAVDALLPLLDCGNPLPAGDLAFTGKIKAKGAPGGPFTPVAFDVLIRAKNAGTNVLYAITGVPDWLDVTSTWGTVDFTGSIVTFSLNANADALPVGKHLALINVNNAGGGKGGKPIKAQLQVK